MPTLEKSSDIIGKKFSMLTVIEDLGRPKRDREVLAKCECGIIKSYLLFCLKNGNTQSCGCIKKERVLKSISTHSLSKHRIYKLWCGMKNRCYCENNTNYKNYGGRGVTVCDEWKDDFMNFYKWAMDNGWQEGLKLDKDKLSPYKTGNQYSPQFCCFITQKENMRHTKLSRMVTYKGETKNLSAWCEELGVAYNRMRRRLTQLQWSPEKTFETPIKKYS